MNMEGFGKPLFAHLRTRNLIARIGACCAGLRLWTPRQAYGHFLDWAIPRAGTGNGCYQYLRHTGRPNRESGVGSCLLACGAALCGSEPAPRGVQSAALHSADRWTARLERVTHSRQNAVTERASRTGVVMAADRLGII
jgi:hypothetical protein